MSYYEALTMVISFLSVIVAVTSLVRTRRLTEEQARLAQVTAELSLKQIAQIDSQEQAKRLPKLHVDLVKLGSERSLIIVNRGEGSALDLKLELIDCPNSPLSDRHLNDNFPHPELHSQARIKIPAFIHMQSPTKYLIRLSWRDIGDSRTSKDFHIAL